MNYENSVYFKNFEERRRKRRKIPGESRESGKLGEFGALDVVGESSNLNELVKQASRVYQMDHTHHSNKHETVAPAVEIQL